MTTSTEEKSDADLLPLVPIAFEFDDTRKSNYRLLSDPATATSVKYDFHMNQLDGSEPLREVLNFRRNVTKLATGSALTADDKAPQLILMVSRMLHSSANDAFHTGIDDHLKMLLADAQVHAYEAVRATAADPDNMSLPESTACIAARDAVVQPLATQVTLELGLDELVKVLSPFRALARVKRHLRRNTRKPADMTIRTYVSRFMRINEEELPLLPPFKTDNKLDKSEMIEIWQYAIPSSWNRKLQEQGKDPVLMTAAEFITATEFIESSEQDFSTVKSKKEGQSSASKKKKNSSNDKSGSLKYCKVHGKNSTHSSADCKVLKEQRSSGKSTEKKSYSKNKTWSRDANKSTGDSKKELALFIAKTVKKELNSFAAKGKNKKRKGDLNAVDRDTNQEESDDDSFLKDFDYEQLENLSLSDVESVHSTKSESE